MKDTTNADLTIKATGYQWKWGYDYLKGEGEGIRFLSTLRHHAPRDLRRRRQGRRADDYLLKVDNPLVVPVNKKVRIITTANDVIHAWGVPALRRQAGRDSRLRARHLVPRREDRRLLRPVLRAVRQGARLHADPREGGLAADYTAWVDGKKKEAGRQGRRPDQGLDAAPTSSRAARRSTPPTARPATRPTARAPARSSRSTARRSCSTPTRPSRSTSCSTARQRRHAGLEAAVATPRSPPSSPTPRTTGPTRPASSCSRPKCWPSAASNRRTHQGISP